jgi:hypothetical protein
MYKWRFMMTVCLLFTGVSGSAKQDMSASDILKASDTARGGGLPGIAWSIHLQSKDSGSQDTRELTVKAAGHDSLVEFTAPAKVKGQKILTVGRNMWFAQPGLQKSVPISPRQRLTGQASNGDVASTDYFGDYTPTLTKEEVIGGEPCYVLDLHAKDKSATYDRIVYWVSKARLVGVKADFYTVSGKKLKTATLEYHNKVEYQGHSVAFISRMTISSALDAANITVMDYASVKAARIPADEFNINLLTN